MAVAEDKLSAERTFGVATDEAIISLINAAHDRVVFIGPGLSESVASAIGARMESPESPKLSITVILDSDPEVFRLGLGTIEGLLPGVNYLGLSTSIILAGGSEA